MEANTERTNWLFLGARKQRPRDFETTLGLVHGLAVVVFRLPAHAIRWQVFTDPDSLFDLSREQIHMLRAASLIDSYSDGPQSLRALMQSVDHAQFDSRPITGQWSIREVVCHLADAEIVYADRMKRVLAEDCPTFFECDPNLFVPALSLQERSPETELSLIEAVRKHMLPILRSLDESDFERQGRHSLDGLMSLETLLERITHHIPHHARFIADKVSALSR